jgi:outer membrane murein-binding lipoprotein Lpp
VNDWAVIWLGTIAISVLVMALIQVGLIVIGLRAARQLSSTVDDLRKEIRPLAEKVNVIADKVNRIADEAGRATALATTQIERVDQMMSVTAARLDEGLTIARNAMGGPLRQGYAVALAVRAALSVFTRRSPRGGRTSSPGMTHDEEDALFVG